MKTLTATISLFLCFPLSGYTQRAFRKKSDTLNVAYTYWWPTGGPFIGLCGEPYSIVFTGTIIKVHKPLLPHKTHDSTIELFTPQKGIIKIESVIFKKSPELAPDKTRGQSYKGESFFSSDCFFNSNLKEGDKVMIFIYSYEGYYSIPGNSILKVKDFDDPIIISIKKFIRNNQDPLSIASDTTLWRNHGFDYELKQIISCKTRNK